MVSISWTADDLVTQGTRVPAGGLVTQRIRVRTDMVLTLFVCNIQWPP